MPQKHASMISWHFSPKPFGLPETFLNKIIFNPQILLFLARKTKWDLNTGYANSMFKRWHSPIPPVAPVSICPKYWQLDFLQLYIKK